MQATNRKNTIIVWFRNDLRIRDNEALATAIKNADTVIPIYCFDPRHFATTAQGFPKTGAFRAQFLIETIADLRHNLKELGGNLIVRTGEPEAVIFALAKFYKAKAVYCHQEATSEEEDVEIALDNNLRTEGIKLDYFWGATLYHYDDWCDYKNIDELPDIFTQFRKQVEKRLNIRPTFAKPKQVNVVANIDEGKIPSIEDLGLTPITPSKLGVMPFTGGETQALLRLKHYFWEGNHLKSYKQTRNGLLGADYSSKFSPWLANGSVSPRTIYEEVKKYEDEIVSNDSTYWLVFELIWRDYFRYVAMKYGNDIFKKKGIKQVPNRGTNNMAVFNKWANAKTGIPFIDANMRELNQTGFMSNRGRQNVASFLVKDMKVNWQLGAEYFESLLLDYDPCSNYGNWIYVAGIGNDPHENRYFNVLTQANRYDKKGIYVKHWCPELKKLPSTRIHEPYLLNKTEQTYTGVHIGGNYPYPCININTWQAKRKAQYR